MHCRVRNSLIASTDARCANASESPALIFAVLLPFPDQVGLHHRHRLRIAPVACYCVDLPVRSGESQFPAISVPADQVDVMQLKATFCTPRAQFGLCAGYRNCE